MKKHTHLIIILLASIGMSLTVCQNMPAHGEEEPLEEISRLPNDLNTPIRVAVIDTGFDSESDWASILKTYKYMRKPKLCTYGHQDFTGFGLQDHNGHGTHIASTIAFNAKDSNYCLIILKFFDKIENSDYAQLNTILALKRAIELKVDMINYSAGGNTRSAEECDVIKNALDLGITVVTAAGNEANNINVLPYYPAMCDSRIKVVANIKYNGDYHTTSNYSDGGPMSRLLYKEIGDHVLGLTPNNTVGFMTGTSQAAAIFTGKTIQAHQK